MADSHQSPPGILLGQSTPAPTHYNPGILFPIERSSARDALGIDGQALPFQGEDVWHAWELSWLGPDGCPRAGVGRFHVPCNSPALVESKSLKLYLNSLNQHAFNDESELGATIAGDLSEVVAAAVGVEVLMPGDSRLAPTELPGDCLDGLQPQTSMVLKRL